MSVDKREFSAKVQRDAVFANTMNGRVLHCACCNVTLLSREELHFDHIKPYSKGGKSTLSNCQILCIACNLKKSNKDQEDFIVESQISTILDGKQCEAETKDNKVSKESFDKIVDAFIKEYGNIYKNDFFKVYNNLPAYHYVYDYYGGMNNLRVHFGIKDYSLCWNRELIKRRLLEFYHEKGNIIQKDLTKENALPSLPCILKYFPEYKNFREIKYGLLPIEDVEKQQKWI